MNEHDKKIAEVMGVLASTIDETLSKTCEPGKKLGFSLLVFDFDKKSKVFFSISNREDLRDMTAVLEEALKNKSDEAAKNKPDEAAKNKPDEAAKNKPDEEC